MILYFNPGHETAVLNGSPYYTAPANVAAMQRELAFLPAWYGSNGDIVLCEDMRQRDYLNFLCKQFPDLPRAIDKEELVNHEDMEVSVWGMSPQTIHYFEELAEKYDIRLNSPMWDNEYLYLNSRQAARDCLSVLCKRMSDIPTDLMPQFYTSLDDIESAVNASCSQLLAKAPYSSSGRGLLWLPVSGLTRTERQVLHGILKKQGSVSVEKAVNKKVDFAMEFLCDGKGKVEFAGYSLFDTNAKGSYTFNYILRQEEIEAKLTGDISSSLLYSVRKEMSSILAELYASKYKGCIGVDMMIYEDGNEYKLHPCVEINMRYNMGYLSLKLRENYIIDSSRGRFYLDFYAKEGEVYRRHLEAEKRFPPVFRDGRIEEGYLSLCPILEDSRYWAYVLIEKLPYSTSSEFCANDGCSYGDV
ncbi:MAG: hypothetical protein LBV43_12690 [Prevotella sp.]|nr:hypothetical protein [Prevotella sp.]